MAVPYVGTFGENQQAGGKASQGAYNQNVQQNWGRAPGQGFQTQGLQHGLYQNQQQNQQRDPNVYPPVQQQTQQRTQSRGGLPNPTQALGIDNIDVGGLGSRAIDYVNGVMPWAGGNNNGGMSPGYASRWVEQPYGDGYYESYVADRGLNPYGQPTWVGGQGDYDKWMGAGGREQVRNQFIDQRTSMYGNAPIQNKWGSGSFMDWMGETLQR